LGGRGVLNKPKIYINQIKRIYPSIDSKYNL
jgi:hypothetical protein